MSDLKLPEPLTVNKNIARKLDELEKKGETIFAFGGHINILTMFELFLIKKYKSKCIVFGNKTNEYRPIGLIIKIKMKYTNEEEEEMKEDFQYISKKLVECIKKGENTIIIPITYYKGNGSHANVLIYRKNLNQLEQFEPHGESFVQDEKLQNVLLKVMKMLTNTLNFDLKKNNLPQVNYVEASQVCPYIRGLQLLETDSKIQKSQKEPLGYCAAWSMFFSELCLKNPEISSSEIMNDIYYYLTTKPSAENYLKKVIRGYAGYIFETTNKYLEIFFKPKLTVVDILNFQKNGEMRRSNRLYNALIVLVKIESAALLDPDFNLEKELKKVKKTYREKTKGMTEEEARKERNTNRELSLLYYKKRILQNYEEYSNYGKITEPILESPLEIKREEIVNPTIINKGKLTKKNKTISTREKKTTQKSLKVKKTFSASKTKKNNDLLDI